MRKTSNAKSLNNLTIAQKKLSKVQLIKCVGGCCENPWPPKCGTETTPAC